MAQTFVTDIFVENDANIFSTVFPPTSTATTASGTLTLTAASASAQVLTGSATGFSLKLPDATTLLNGQTYELYNQASTAVTLKDGSGATLFTLSQNSVAYGYLQTNGTVAGGWIFWQNVTNSGALLISYNLVSTTSFATSANADTLITGFTVTPQAGTYGIWYGAQNTASGAGAQLDCTIYNNGSAIVDSKRSNLSTTGTHIFQNSTQTISQFAGGTNCDVRVDANGNSMTVGARSLLMIRLGP